MADWTIIVEPAPAQDADREFEDWKRINPVRAALLAPEDIRIDTIRSAKGTLRRYQVRLPPEDIA